MIRSGAGVLITDHALRATLVIRRDGTGDLSPCRRPGGQAGGMWLLVLLLLGAGALLAGVAPGRVDLAGRDPEGGGADRLVPPEPAPVGAGRHAAAADHAGRGRRPGRVGARDGAGAVDLRGRAPPRRPRLDRRRAELAGHRARRRPRGAGRGRGLAAPRPARHRVRGRPRAGPRPAPGPGPPRESHDGPTLGHGVWPGCPDERTRRGGRSRLAATARRPRPDPADRVDAGRPRPRGHRHGRPRRQRRSPAATASCARPRAAGWWSTSTRPTAPG